MYYAILMEDNTTQLNYHIMTIILLEWYQLMSDDRLLRARRSYLS